MIQILRNKLGIIALFALLLSQSAIAQNTIGGVKQEIPLAEVDRQSDFLDAESLRMLGKYEKAIDAYKKFIYDNPTYGAAWYGMSRSYTELKDYNNALETIAKAIEQERDNEWYYLHQADLFERTGRNKDAIKVYETLTKRFPNKPVFYEQLAYLAVLDGNPKAGLSALDKLEKLTGLTDALATKKHLIYIGMGDSKKAAAELVRLVDAYPENLEYRHRLATFYTEIGDKAAAQATYADILRRDPDDAAARLGALDKGRQNSDITFLQSLQPLFRDPRITVDAKIKEIAPYLLKLQKDNDPALAAALFELGDIATATHPDDPKVWSLSGDLRYLANQPDAALERYRKCISLHPVVFSVWDNALTILSDQQKYNEVLTLAEQAMDIFPNQPKAYYYYGVAANALRRYNDALTQLNQAQRMAGTNIGFRLDITDQLGQAYLGNNDAATAIAKYENALSTLKGADQHPGLLEHYGDALLVKGEKDRAIEQWRKAYTLRKSARLEQKLKS